MCVCVCVGVTLCTASTFDGGKPHATCAHIHTDVRTHLHLHLHTHSAGAFLYNCPVYLTTFRGATYVCMATLKTPDNPDKWTLAGVALVMQTNGA